MEQIFTSSFKLGIVGGGQLGKMLALAANTWDVQTYVLDTNPEGPCASVCTEFIAGDCKDFDAVYSFGQQVDLITFEVENINVEALQKLKEEGKRIHPDPDALSIIQDKGLQKEFYEKHGILSPEFKTFVDKNELLAAIKEEKVRLPFVQKARRGGYDGKGVAIIQDENDLSKVLDGPSLIETKVDIDKEIAVIVHRNTQGEVACFPPVEMEFNPETNLVEWLVCPADISEEMNQKSRELAEEVINRFDMCGTLAVEMFLDTSGELWVNEVAPRPHNSGHHTIESLVTSQYEQHLRSIFGLPLGSTQIKLPAVMINLLGELGYEGPVKIQGLEESMAQDGVKVHIYGKKETKPSRKMGHVTIMDSDIEKAKEKAKFVQHNLKIIA